VTRASPDIFYYSFTNVVQKGMELAPNPHYSGGTSAIFVYFMDVLTDLVNSLLHDQ